jgi:hypothetical protein
MSATSSMMLFLQLSSSGKRAEDNAIAAAGMAMSGKNVYTFGYKDAFGPDTDLPDMVTGTGASIWQLEDPVHLSRDAYDEMAVVIMAMTNQSETPIGRERLNSVVPGQRNTVGKRRVPKPSPWVIGMAAGGGQRRPYRGGYRGGAPLGRIWARAIPARRWWRSFACPWSKPGPGQMAVQALLSS